MSDFSINSIFSVSGQVSPTSTLLIHQDLALTDAWARKCS
jgi:hypothetical protein